MTWGSIAWRVGIWGLASLSFACLLGAFYGFWGMKAFACWVLVPATVLLGWIAWRRRGEECGPGAPGTWIAQGALAGVVAAVAYDLFRLPFVLAGYPLFAVFPRFGQMLLGRPGDDWSPLVQVVGWTYHFTNAAALGVMFLAMVSTWTRARLVWGGIAWAASVEIFLLLTPYYGYFKLELPFATFLVLTLSAHLLFGAVLGIWCWWRLGRPALARASLA